MHSEQNWQQRPLDGYGQPLQSAGRRLDAVIQQKSSLTLSLSMLPETWIISPWTLSGTMLSIR